MYDLEQLLEELLETGASPGTLHLVLTKIKDRGHTSLVIQQCRKALNLHPNHDGLRTLLAEAYLDQGLAAQASEELERVTRRLDEAARAYKLLADALLRQGRDSEATACLERYLAHQPDDTLVQETLARLRPPAQEAPQPEPAVPGESGEEPSPEEPIPEIATPTLAELYYSQGQIEAAVETYERILARSPDDSRATSRLRELKELMGKPAGEPAVEETAPAEEPTLDTEVLEAGPPDEEVFEEEVPETAPVEELAPETVTAEAVPPEEAFEPEAPAPPVEAGPPEPAPLQEKDFESEAPETEAGPSEEGGALAAEQRATRRMIAVLEEWLSRIHETGTHASA